LNNSVEVAAEYWEHFFIIGVDEMIYEIIQQGKISFVDWLFFNLFDSNFSNWLS